MRAIFLCLPAVLLLSACASTPDPAEVCTSEWIAPRATKAVGKIESSARSSLKTFSSVSKTWAKGDTPNLVQLWSLNKAMNKMKKELTRGQGIKDLKTVAKRCNDPNIIKDSMSELFRKQGMSENIVSWIENSPIYDSLIASIAEPTPVTPNG